MESLHFRHYGNSGKQVILVHGGPAAAGSMGPVARELRDVEVFEPWQRESSDVPLTVAIHVEDLHEFISKHCSGKPIIIGHSWGAMLALAYAANYSNEIEKVILIGCGTFDTTSRAEFKRIVESRMDENFRALMSEIENNDASDDKKLAAKGELYENLYCFERYEGESEANSCSVDKTAHEQTWNDMLLQQQNGTYPAAFTNISVPVVAIHGDYDPHPGKMLIEHLSKFVKNLEYVELEKCGHSPWEEKHAREEFFTLLAKNLEREVRSEV